MKIKEIELIGFKSFADRAIFPLHNGITCIVGPNGCGKSNIVDAFRWVLGEQSAKSLRGDRMEEVIFQGSAAKKQKGMAEVALTVSQLNSGTEGRSNGEEKDAEEITVSRRLYRSGESEYFMNKMQCRLRDIKEIFLDTGLDVKSYSIIDQGKIGEIINTKPEERRFLIEEAAGVMKYKVRRAEALSKLESSKQNLLRINDIVAEVKRQINSLDRQVKKAERYKRLMGELKEIELRIAKREHLRLIDLLRSILSDIKMLEEADSLKRGELSAIENFIALKRLQLADKEKSLYQLDSRLREKEKALSDFERGAAVLKTEIENKRSHISRLLNQRKEADARKRELTERIIAIMDLENSYSARMQEAAAELQENKGAAGDLEAAINDRESGIENKRKELFTASEILSSKKNELHKLQSSCETLKYREGASSRDREITKKEIETLQMSAEETKNLIDGKTAEYSKIKAERDSLLSEINILRTEIEDKKSLQAKQREGLASNLSRLNSLKELTIDKSVADFLQLKNAGASANIPGANAHGADSRGYKMLSDILIADRNSETAVEALLSEKIDSLIIEKAEDLFSTLKLISEKGLSRTAMLYTGFGIENSEQKILNEEILSNDAVIGKVADFIKFDDAGAEKIGIAIFKNAYIVKDFESAISILKALSGEHDAHYPALSLITTEGEVIHSDGWVFAGQSKGVLKRKREIKELQKMTEDQQKRIRDVENELDELSNNLTDKKETLKSIDSSIIDLEKMITLSNHSLKGQTEELERKKRKLSYLETEISTISQEKKSIEELLGIKAREISELQKNKDLINEDIAEIQQSLAAKRSEYEGLRSHITDLKLSVASFREKIEAIKREREGIENTVREGEKRKELSIKETNEAEENIKASLEELKNIDELVKTTVLDIDSIRKERERLKSGMDLENHEIMGRENSLKTLRTQIDAASKELSELNTKAAENRIRVENIEQGVMQKYGIDIRAEEIKTDGLDSAGDENRSRELNEKIRELGPVNLGTIEEYEELKNRYDFLTAQQQDLTMSIAELEEAIGRINATTKRKLREAYDSLRVKFSRVFTTLFGGGRADMILTNDENILESGIEIIAQPPGKKLQNLNLLSGGEKALTSLSILFAGFLIKPSPLCILDEADAPLDESNTVRFTGMIKELSRETQFIIITHNRTTMEVADYLYGITMEEPGASKAISLQFADVENIA